VQRGQRDALDGRDVLDRDALLELGHEPGQPGARLRCGQLLGEPDQRGQ
jgi:hypothetical protein